MKRNESNENTLKRRPKCCTLQFYKPNFSFCILILIYVLIQIGLVIQIIILCKDSNAAVVVSHIAGVLLDFNMSFINRIFSYSNLLFICKVVFFLHVINHVVQKFISVIHHFILM